jgi:hypothetical protein
LRLTTNRALFRKRRLAVSPRGTFCFLESCARMHHGGTEHTEREEELRAFESMALRHLFLRRAFLSSIECD